MARDRAEETKEEPPRQGTVREDGKIWYDCAWRSKVSVKNRKYDQNKRRRTPEYREKQKLKRRERRKKPEEAEKDRARGREYYHKHREEELARKKKYVQKNREEVNRKQREYYDQNKEEQLRKIKERRWRADPTRGLHTVIEQVKRGELDITTATKRFSESLARISEISEQSSND